MPTLDGQNILPGVYSQIQPNLLPAGAAGLRVPAFIGTGRLTNLVSNEPVVRGATPPPFTDPLLNFATSIDGNIQDANFVIYQNGLDFALNSGGVGWLSNAAFVVGTTAGPFAGLNGLTFQIAISTTAVPGAVQIIPLDGTDVDASSTATTLNNYFTAHTIAAIASHPATVAATGTVTIVNFAALAGATLTVHGDALVEGVAWSAATSNTAAATSLAAAITTATGTTFSTATSTGNVVTITANALGLPGNSITLTTSDGTNMPVSGATLTGGGESLEVATTATSDANLYIGTGTANTILGFTAGSYQQTPQSPAAGVTYYVTYEYAKVTSDYTPKFYFTLQAVTNDYGPVQDSTSIPTACSLAFQNGAAIVCVCQENPADGSPVAQVQSALNKLLSTQNISIVVSLEGTHNAQLISAIKQHVDIASSTINRLERTAMIGYEGVFSDTDMLNLALAASDKRIVSINQSGTTNTMIIGTDQNASVVGGQYMAAALAGVRCNPEFDVAQPMTREIISGIATSNTLTQAEKSLLVNQGVCIIDNVSGVPKVLFGTSTDFSTIANQLFQVTQITDYVAQTLRGLLDPIFIGQRLLSTTPSQIQTVTAATLTTIQNANIITGFTAPVAAVDSVVPTQINLTVGIFPTLELDVIFITLGLNLQ